MSSFVILKDTSDQRSASLGREMGGDDFLLERGNQGKIVTLLCTALTPAAKNQWSARQSRSCFPCCSQFSIYCPNPYGNVNAMQGCARWCAPMPVLHVQNRWAVWKIWIHCFSASKWHHRLTHWSQWPTVHFFVCLFAFPKSFICFRVSSQSIHFTIALKQGLWLTACQRWLCTFPSAGTDHPLCPDFLHQHYAEKTPLDGHPERMSCAVCPLFNSLLPLPLSPYCKPPMENNSIACSLLTRKAVLYFWRAWDVCMGNFLNTIRWECTTYQVLCLQPLIYLFLRNSSNNSISWTLLSLFHRWGEATLPISNGRVGVKPKPGWCKSLTHHQLLWAASLYPHR